MGVWRHTGRSSGNAKMGMSCRCGALGEGDELLSVDGVGLECATLAEAAQLLKGADAHGLINLHILPHHQVTTTLPPFPSVSIPPSSCRSSIAPPPCRGPRGQRWTRPPHPARPPPRKARFPSSLPLLVPSSRPLSPPEGIIWGG